jgi:uncharacterized protein
MTKTSLQPKPDRVIALDVLRGIALLGILLMNIQSFSMIGAAYINPLAFGDLTGANKTVWMLSHALADQKFMSIFSMLFGAGILLFTDNVQKKGFLPLRFFYRRMLWLLVIGLVHAYLLWHGDILVAYAACGALAYLFRKMNPLGILAIGFVLFLVPSFNYWLFGKSMAMWPPEALDDLRLTWAPDQEAIAREVAALTGSATQQLLWRIPEAFKMQTFIFLTHMGWRIMGCMLIGMALFRLRFIQAGWRKGAYALIAATSLAFGYWLIKIGIDKNFAANWSLEYSMFFGSQWNYHGSLAVAIGYVSLTMLLVKFWSFQPLASVGRMAFTNYLLMTIICTFTFYGYGLGFFGQFERLQQLIFVIAVWVFLIPFSWLWLRKFYFGPVEWFWRYMTYGNKPLFVRR